jgi:hypothetical protein
MADLVTIFGGGHGHGHGHHSGLTAFEHQAALQALEKLKAASGVGRGVASVLGGGLRSATSKGGTNLLTAKTETFAGGVHSDVKASIRAIGSDTVVAGSAFTKAELLGRGGTSAVGGLSADTIKAAGLTAATVKNDAAEPKSAGHTITMSDKTSITLSGISTHDVIKPH